MCMSHEQQTTTKKKRPMRRKELKALQLAKRAFDLAWLCNDSESHDAASCDAAIDLAQSLIADVFGIEIAEKVREIVVSAGQSDIKFLRSAIAEAGEELESEREVRELREIDQINALSQEIDDRSAKVNKDFANDELDTIFKLGIKRAVKRAKIDRNKAHEEARLLTLALFGDRWASPVEWEFAETINLIEIGAI